MFFVITFPKAYNIFEIKNTLRKIGNYNGKFVYVVIARFDKS
ncbi:hypothetical protein GNIT_0160 [Glaciecola nitratireducens FR1064]|uniref:Uncharacterized protein n=1 Tax=Glaciecola nitratireducens (strain JCM 12485 / KCTC 12276 / FR1064) TaxID=1085623 RepID=G4QIX4_GLANF|nr:hypothetical protein GNIT_0160 [Glaciecola nitratireducens FR1064]